MDLSDGRSGGRSDGATERSRPRLEPVAAVDPHRVTPVAAFMGASVVVLVITAILVPFGQDLPRVVPALLLLAPVIAAGLLSGRLVAAAVAIETAVVFALGFLPPIGSPLVELGHDAIALVIFAVVAGALGTIISTVVTSERRRALAERSQVASLQEVDAQRSALLRSVSHDLRTPLASIRAVVTDLQADTPFDPATRDELLEIVAAECERLDRLVANLLSMSRIEAGAFLPERETVDLAELIETSVARLEHALVHVQIVLELADDLPVVEGDFVQLDQVVSNLVENAARHSPEGGRVTVAAEAEAGRSMVRLTVVDEGPGIPVALRDEVLEPFRTAGGTTSTGIGLAICRSIIGAHGGTIHVDDAPHGGACLVVRLPAHRSVCAGDR